MDNPIYLRPKNTAEIDLTVRTIVIDFLTELKNQGEDRVIPPERPEDVDPLVLMDLPDAIFHGREGAEELLQNLCRLLIRQGDRRALDFALRLSHRLYNLSYVQGETGYSYLFKGISQVGLIQPDVGIKNVLAGLGHVSELQPFDQVLGYWALLSAAIVKRNLFLAEQYARQWRQAAEAGSFEEEIFRSHVALQILNLLAGRREACREGMSLLTRDTPPAYQGVISFLESWTACLTGGECMNPDAFKEPIPIFLGLDWQGEPGVRNGRQPFEDFRRLCWDRRQYGHFEAVEKGFLEDREKVLAYALTAARWELSRPLRGLGAVLKKHDPSEHIHFTMTRVLGRSIFDKIMTETDISPEVETPQDAVILIMDVRGYSGLSERSEPQDLFNIINPLFKIMCEELEEAGGAVLEFPGDALIFVFNAFQERKSSPIEILSATVRALQRLYMLNVLSKETGLPEIRIGVGINKGPTAVGYVGGLARCHLTVMGNTVNLASRIESATKTLPGDIMVARSLFDDAEPEFWREPEKINFTIRDLDRHIMRGISRPVHLYGVRPLVKHLVDFVPMGFTARPAPGIVYIDTGNSGEHGVIDHHFADHKANSACELLVQKPELLLGHITGNPESQIEFRLHRQPDLDCAATLYTAFELMDHLPRTKLLEKLSEYVSLIDQGLIPEPEKLGHSLYGIFLAHQRTQQARQATPLTDLDLLKLELRVIDAAMYLLEKAKYSGELAYIFQLEPDWFPEERHLIEQDMIRFNEDVKQRGQVYRAPVNGRPEPVMGLELDHPQSILFKFWARTDPKAPGGKGYRFLNVNWSSPGKNRFVISVDPESGTNLRGLGQALERVEAEQRKRLGMERPIHPSRYPSDNSDPWYFGQGHAYTIVDSPRAGTVLDAEQVRGIHRNWTPKIED